MDEIGRIYGDVIDNQFTFVTKVFFEGDFVKIKGDDNSDNPAELVCEIVSRSIYNKFMISPEMIKYMDNAMDLQKDTLYTYKVSVIGVVKNGKVSYDKVMPLPGKNVYTVDADILKQVYGITDTGVAVGYLKKMPGCRVTLEADRIFQPHMFVVGKTGSGKSYFMKHFLCDIKEKFWVFSPSDEYSNMDEKLKIKKMKEFVLALDIDNLSYYMNLNASEELILKNIEFKNNIIYSSKEMKEEIYNYYRDKQRGKSKQMILDLGQEIEEEIDIPAYANSLISKLRNIRHLKFSKDSKKVSIPKESAIFDMSDYSQQEQESIINFYLFRLLLSYKKMKEENRKKHIIVIEEAHNFVPSTRNTLSKDILVKLSREGRKYGISLCFITQRPRYFDQTALSQSGNKVIFSLPNPDDVKHVIEDIAYYKPELACNIQGQRRGECIIAGDAYNDVLELMIDFH